MWARGHNRGPAITKIRPDVRYVSTDGFSCVKGLEQYELHGSPDRLRYPLARTARGDYARASWDQANSSIGIKLAQLRRDHGPDSIALYVGTPAFASGFMTGIGSGSLHASATQDCANKFAVARHIDCGWRQPGGVQVLILDRRGGTLVGVNHGVLMRDGPEQLEQVSGVAHLPGPSTPRAGPGAPRLTLLGSRWHSERLR